MIITVIDMDNQYRSSGFTRWVLEGYRCLGASVLGTAHGEIAEVRGETVATRTRSCIERKGTLATAVQSRSISSPEAPHLRVVQVRKRIFASGIEFDRFATIVAWTWDFVLDSLEPLTSSIEGDSFVILMSGLDVSFLPKEVIFFVCLRIELHAPGPGTF